MAGSFTPYLSKALLDHAFGSNSGGTAYTPPANWHVGLFTTAPTAGSEGSGVEVVASAVWLNYARISVANSLAQWPAATLADPSLKSNGAIITWPAATGSGGTIVVAVGIWDAATSGNLVAWADQSPSKTISTSDTPSFAIGELDISLD